MPCGRVFIVAMEPAAKRSAATGQSLAESSLRVLLLVLSLLHILTFLYLSTRRVGYPFELEWMEGGMLQQVHRILAGEPLYVPPSLDFTPFLYTPLYFYFAAWLTPVLGEGFLPLRLLSLVATVVSACLIFASVRASTRSALCGLVAASLFVACFEIAGAWYDLARVDSLFLVFLLVALFVLERRPGLAGQVLGAVALVLAFLTKQSALTAAVPLVVYWLVVSKGRARWCFPLVLLFGLGVSWGGLHQLSGGWFTFYAFELPAAHPFAWRMLGEFWWADLGVRLPVALVAAAVLLTGRGAGSSRRGLSWELAVCAAFLGTAWLSRLHVGGHVNVLMPAYAWLATLLGRGLAGPLESRRSAVRVVALLLCIGQLGWLLYDPRSHLPSADDEAAGRALVESLRAEGGEVWLPSHGWLASAAGGTGSAHRMALLDVLRGGDREVAAALEREVHEVIASGRWEVILLDGDWNKRKIRDRYLRDGSVFDDGRVFWTVTGHRTRPQTRYRRK